VRANGQNSAGSIYTLGFKATNKGGEGSCSGAVKVCVEDLNHQGKCVATGQTYDATQCRR
jgi:hypothetical protein